MALRPDAFPLVSAPPVVTATPRSAARVSDDNTSFALDVSAVSDEAWWAFDFSGVEEMVGVLAPGDSGFVSGPVVPSVSVFVDGSVAVEPGSVGPAQATPWPVATAAPMPSATANPPTRPM